LSNFKNCYKSNQSLLAEIVSIIFLLGTKVFAYNPDCTHPMLSQRAAELYNRQFGARFTAPQINRLIQGSYHEDIGVNPYFRSTNHFYDVHNQREWRDPVALGLGTYFLSACFYDAFKKGNIQNLRLSNITTFTSLITVRTSSNGSRLFIPQLCLRYMS
jgi:hypothetical protein